MNKKGFTLSELLMVIVILGILSAVALPRFGSQKEKAYVAEAVGIMSAIRQLEESARLDNGNYTTLTAASTAADWTTFGMDSPNGSQLWQYSVAVAGATHTITATRQIFRWSGSDPFANQTITLTNAGVYGGSHPNRPT